MITLTAAAAQEIRRLQLSHNPDKRVLRFTVQSGGCADFVYGLELVETPTPGDQSCRSEGIEVTVAADDAVLLSGLCLDYTEDLMGGGFRFNNPQSVRTCSCGHSFAIAPDLGAGI